MKYYQLNYRDGRKQIVSAETDLALIRKYDLATKAHIGTQIIQLDSDGLDASIRALSINQGVNI